VKPTVMASPLTSDMEINRDVTLVCSVNSTTSAPVQWYKAPNTIIANVADKIEVTGSNLKILSLKTSDEGNYYCTATNTGGKSLNSNNATLTVFSKHIIFFDII